MSQESPVRTVPVCSPRLEPSLGVKLVGEVDVCSTVQQRPQVYSRSLEMNSVDLKVTPVERAVRIVVVDFAVAQRVLCPLHGERDSAVRTEFITSVLLVRRQPVAKLTGLGHLSLRLNGRPGFLFHDSGCNNHWPLPTHSERRAQ
jgi:hypothetical protein